MVKPRSVRFCPCTVVASVMRSESSVAAKPMSGGNGSAAELSRDTGPPSWSTPIDTGWPFVRAPEIFFVRSVTWSFVGFSDRLYPMTMTPPRWFCLTMSTGVCVSDPSQVPMMRDPASSSSEKSPTMSAASSLKSAGSASAGSSRDDSVLAPDCGSDSAAAPDDDCVSFESASGVDAPPEQPASARVVVRARRLRRERNMSPC